MQFILEAFSRRSLKSKKGSEGSEVLYSLDSQMVEPLWPSLVDGPVAVDYTLDKIPDTDYESIIWGN